MDKKTYEGIVAALGPEVHHRAARLIDPTYAPSVAQQTITEALAAFDRFTGDAEGVRKLVFTILGYRAIDRDKKERRRKQVALPDDERLGGSGLFPAANAFAAPAVDQALEEARLHAALWAAVDALPADERDIVTLHLRHRVALADVADRLGKERHVVYDAYARAKRRLARVLRDERDEGDR